MKYPRLVILAFDDWLANQLTPLATEHKWLLKDQRQSAGALAILNEPRPTVFVVQLDPHHEQAAAFDVVADALRIAPQVATVVVSDAKLPEAERAAWTTAALDFGARYVLFPPLTRSVLEDVVSGLMASLIRRLASNVAWQKVSPEPVIDLADEGAL